MEYKVKSLAKALEILECFTLDTPELGVSEIAKALDLPKSTVHNVLTTYQQMGYVTQDPHTNRYSLGLKLLQLSRTVSLGMDVRELLIPYLNKIAAALRECVLLGVPYGENVLYIACRTDGLHASQRDISGALAPLYCTGIGKAMLAYLPDPEGHLPAQLHPFTRNTITDPQALMKELEHVRRQGYALDDMEHEFGIRCIAVPVFGNDGSVRCAVSVSGPSPRFRTEDLDAMAAEMIQILQPIQHRL